MEKLSIRAKITLWFAVALVLVMSISSESSRRWVSDGREDKVVSYNLRHPNRGVSVE